MAPKGHHKRQDGRKGGAHSGGAQAQPAAQRRTAIELTAASEASVRSILQELETPQQQEQAAAAAAAGSGRQLQRAYAATYEQLVRYGFKHEQVQSALRALPLGSGADLEAALDWLCLNLPQSQLPRRFAGAARGGGAGGAGAVKVVSIATADAAGGSSAAGSAAGEPAAGPPAGAGAGYESSGGGGSSSGDDSDGGESGGSDAGVGGGKQGGADEKAAAKAWILQQYGGDSGDDNADGGASGGEGAASEDSVIEDWELWGDPREIERRRAERAFSNLPESVRRRQLACEFARAKDWAASAKAAGYKDKQREAGQLIGLLKAEMAKLKLSDAEAMEIAAEEGAVASTSGKVPGGKAAATELAEQQQQEQEEQEQAPAEAGQGDWREEDGAGAGGATAEGGEADGGGGGGGGSGGVPEDWELTSAALFDDDAPEASCGLAGNAGGGDAGAREQQEPAAGAAGGGDAFELPDLFDLDAPSDLAPSAAAAAAAPAAAAPAQAAPGPPPALTPWGAYGAARRGDKPSRPGGGGRRAPEAPRPERRPPKALLQQLCLRMGWAPPRFERITAPSAAAAAAAGGGGGGAYRYKVTVEPAGGAPAGRGGRGGRGGGRGGGGAQLPKTFQLLLEEDDWSSIQDAQNAAAARALFDLLKPDPAAKAAAAEQLPDEHAALWARWEGEGGAGRGGRAAEEEERARDEFLKSLLQEKRAAGAAAAAAAAAGDDADASTDAGGDGNADGEEEDLRGAERATAGEEAEEWELAGRAAAGAVAAAAAAEADRVLREMAAERAREEREAAERLAARGEAMRRRLAEWRETQEGRKWARERGQLPMVALREQLVAALAGSDVVVVSGETGSGKTTQVPQFILEEAIMAGAGPETSIVVTQPRRIAATSVAERVAAERGERGPGAPGAMVGYHVRLDAAATRDTRLLFCTTGILLRRLAGDPLLSGVSHVIVDEVHERTMQGDFLMALLKRLLRRRNAAMDAAAAAEPGGQQQPRQQEGDEGEQDGAASAEGEAQEDSEEEWEKFDLPQQQQQQQQQPQQQQQEQQQEQPAAAAPPPGPPARKLPRLKVVLMSATLDAGLYSNYFGGCPVLSCSGRTFPVERLFLEDVYESTGYMLDPASRAAIRGGGHSAAGGIKAAARGDARRAGLLRAGWGDAEADAGPVNPNYDPDLYQGYSQVTRRNLSRLDEGVLDLDLVEAVVRHVDETAGDGAILVFLPGMAEISAVLERLSSNAHFARGHHLLLPLHSAISPQQQRAAFQVPPPGVRKVVLSTNIAETSVTVEDVVYVIDSGRQRERRYNPQRHMSLLVEDWVSRAAAMQRLGRAGRVRPGKCFCLYTRQRFDRQMRRYGVPEISRVPLEELLLQIHLMELGPAASFLSEVIEPPPPKAVQASLNALSDVGAINLGPPDAAAVKSLPPADGAATYTPAPAAAAANQPAAGAAAAGAEGSEAAAAEALTPLGRHLALLPLEPRLGKLLVMGACLGCLAPALTIAAALSYKSPFSAPLERMDDMERAKRALAAPPPAAAAAPGAASAGRAGGARGGRGGRAGAAAPVASAAPAGGGAADPAAFAAGQQSDHFVLIVAFELWRHARNAKGPGEASRIARQHFLSTQTLEQLYDLRLQFAEMMSDTHLVTSSLAGGGGGGARGRGGGGGRGRGGEWADDPRHPCNRYAHDPLMLKAVLVAALAPRISVMAEGCSPGSRPGWLDSTGQAVFIHPSSVNHELPVQRFRHPYLVFLEHTKTSKVFIRDCTVVSGMALLLFGGPLAVMHEAGLLLVGGWLRIRAAAQVGVLVKKLRDAVDGLLLSAIAGGGGGSGGGGSGGGSGGSGGGGGGGSGGSGAKVVETIRKLLLEAEEQADR